MFFCSIKRGGRHTAFSLPKSKERSDCTPCGASKSCHTPDTFASLHSCYPQDDQVLPSHLSRDLHDAGRFMFILIFRGVHIPATGEAAGHAK